MDNPFASLLAGAGFDFLPTPDAGVSADYPLPIDPVLTPGLVPFDPSSPAPFFDPTTQTPAGGDWGGYFNNFFGGMASLATAFRLGGTTPGPLANQPYYRDPITGRIVPTGQTGAPGAPGAPSPSGIVLPYDRLFNLALFGLAAWFILKRL